MTSIPSEPAAVTPAWLTGKLQAAGVLADAQVSAIRWEPIGTGQVGDSARFHLSYDREGAGPATVAGKFPAADAMSRGTAAAFGLYAKEVGFYRELAPQVDIRVPRAHVAEIADDGIEFVLIFEDLGPCRGGNQLDSCSLADARAAMRQAAALHAPSWNNAAIIATEWLKPREGLTEQIRALYDNAQTLFRERYGDILEPEMMAICEELNEARDIWFGHDRQDRKSVV